MGGGQRARAGAAPLVRVHHPTACCGRCSPAGTGTIYWKGAVRAYERSHIIGNGYLELTGYWKPMKL